MAIPRMRKARGMYEANLVKYLIVNNNAMEHVPRLLLLKLLEFKI